MTKNILIVNTENFEAEWLEYFDGLKSKELNFFLLANDPKILSYFHIKQWENNNYKTFLSPDKNFFNALIFFLLRPLAFFYALAFLAYYKFSKKIESIVCFSAYEKLHFTRAANLLGLKIVWIMMPGKNLALPNITRSSLGRLSKKSKTICFTDNCLNLISSKKYNFKNAEAIKIGIGEKYHQEQKSIFQTLAKNTTSNSEKKYFTIGTIQDLSGDVSHFEILFHAIKKCLEVIPQIQFIIAGDGPERKRLSWMAKKMEISNLIWFVGNHKNPLKWLANYDLYISICPIPKLSDLNTILYASSNALPIIAPADSGFDEFIKDKHSGMLVNINDSEELAQAIIELQQNAFKREKIGKNGQEFVIENFKLSKTIDDLYNAIKK